jgi:hypothetical protein
MRNQKLSLKMLLEEEEEEATLDLGTDEDAPADDAGDEEADADDEAADDAGDTETEEENEVEVSPEDETSLRKPLEAQVDAVLADFEMAALKSAKVNESLSLRMLLNEEVVDFDVETFATSVARLIDNYETLLDIEQAIYYRAIEILKKNYGEEFVDAFKQIMHDRYRMDFGDVRADPVKDQAPLALGAGGEGGGGA